MAPPRRRTDRQPPPHAADASAGAQTVMSAFPHRGDILATKPTYDDIAQRAYALYEQRGGEPGHEWDDWFQAERELKQDARPRPADTLLKIGAAHAGA